MPLVRQRDEQIDHLARRLPAELQEASNLGGGIKGDEYISPNVERRPAHT
jgi:hypothetical protein